MKHFRVMIRSFADVQDFVNISSRQPFAVSLGDAQEINGKSMMAVLGLSFRHPLLVSVDCDDAQLASFQTAAARFLA